MAEAAVASAANSIGSLLIQKATSLYGVTVQVEDILAELGQMECFARDVDAKQDENKSIRNLVVEMRNTAYEAEDVIACFVFEVEPRKRGGIRNIFMRYACIFNEVIARNSLVSDILTVKSKIARLKANLQSFGVVSVTNARGGSSSTPQGRSLLRRTYSHLVEEHFVGFEQDIEILVAEVKRHRVVSICGMGGLGKTTLARKVYHHEDLRSHFDAFAWVSISQQWQPKDVFQRILTALIPDKSERVANMIEYLLVKELFEVQQKKKCLVVLDDIWSVDAWKSLSPAFPNEHKGSVIVLTTRNKSVATFVDPSGFVHEPMCLSELESWNLFEKKAYATEFEVDPMTLKLGKEMVEQCGGLPLAIVVLGGLLATKHTLSECQTVHKNVGSYLKKGKYNGGERGGEVLDVLALSYQDLPYQLKLCFLYLGHFAEDSDIDLETLSQLWMAEDIITQEERGAEESMMDVADRYIGELAQRCIIQVKVKQDFKKLESKKICRLHDLMRDLCLLKAKEDNFLKVIDQRRRLHPSFSSSSMEKSIGGSKMRRFAIHKDRTDLFFLEQDETARHVRAVLFFLYDCNLDNSITRQLSRLCKDSKCLRAIHFEVVGDGNSDIEPKELPKEIWNLMLLRFLRLERTGIRNVPSSIGNLRYLQTLDLRASDVDRITVPNVLWKMEGLIHLYLPEHIKLTKFELLRIDGLSNLETLVNVDSRTVDVKGLCKLTNLRRLVLTITCKVYLEKLVNNCLKNCTRLQHMTMKIFSCDLSSEEGLRLLGQVLCCDSLVELELFGIVGKLPEYDHRVGKGLTTLRLVYSRLEGNPMSTIEKLPNLRYLHLNRCLGMEIVLCSAARGFPSLQRLELVGLEIEEWRVEDGAMPSLSYLQISSCKNMKMLPDGLRFISTLKELVIMDMPVAFTSRLRVVDGEAGEDLHKIRHILSVTIDGFTKYEEYQSLMNCIRLQDTTLVISDCDLSSEEGLRLLGQVLYRDSLVQLKLIRIVGKLPEYDHRFGKNLTTLELLDCRLEENPMSTIEKLPNLRSLRLIGYVGLEIVLCSAARGFPSLQHLELKYLGIEEWRVEDGAMPSLSYLVIDSCKNMKMLPDGLRFISTLKQLVIRGMPRAFNNRLRVVIGEGGEDLHKIRHIPSIGIY